MWHHQPPWVRAVLSTLEPGLLSHMAQSPSVSCYVSSLLSSSSTSSSLLAVLLEAGVSLLASRRPPWPTHASSSTSFSPSPPCTPDQLLQCAGPLVSLAEAGPPPLAAAGVIGEVVVFRLPEAWQPFIPDPDPTWSSFERALEVPIRGHTPGIMGLHRLVREHLSFMTNPSPPPPKPLSSDPAALMKAFMAALRQSCAWPLYCRKLEGHPVPSPFADHFPMAWLFHCLHCTACAARGSWEVARHTNEVNPCYFADVLAMQWHGWLYPFKRMPEAADLPNYDSLHLAPHAVAREFAKMAMAGVFGEGTPLVISPLQAVVKESDLEEAWFRLLAQGLVAPEGSVEDEGYVDTLNELLASVGLPEVKARLCLDLSRVVNRLILDVPFAFPPLDEFLAALPDGGFMTKLDFARAFLNVPIHLKHHPYVALRWEDRLYLLCRMLFGVKLGPCICSILTGEVRLAFLALGIPCSTYLDDTGATGRSATEALFRQELMAWVAGLLGWPVNVQKKLEDAPSQVLPFRGVGFNTKAKVMCILSPRLRRTIRLLSSLVQAGVAQCRQWRKALGYLEWVTQVVPDGRPHMAALWEVVPRHYQNHWQVTITAEARHELQWWLSFLSEAAGGSPKGWAPLWSQQWPPHVRIFSDSAKRDGFGAVVEGEVIVGSWRDGVGMDDADDPSSAYKELVPVFYALRHVAPRLPPDTLVVITTDNASNAFNFNFGSACPASRQLFTEIWHLASTHRLFLVGDWIERALNTLPDSLSRLASYASFRASWAAAARGRSRR